MPVKLIQYWNIQHASQSDFDAYFTREYVPRINESGFMKIVGSWHVASGEGPYFITEGVSRSITEVESLIMASFYFDLRQRLLGLVKDYQTKLLVPIESVEPDVPDLEYGYKFNQHFNINPADFYTFLDFEEKVHLPEMKRFGVTIAGGWNVAVGATPYVIDETRADNLEVIGEMLQNPAYQMLTLKLLQLVSNYGCKILVPSGHINN
ncbi:MAG: hypothetical protein PVF29_06675 [Desulfobacterales bacterium]|jgi:hypothetical protein